MNTIHAAPLLTTTAPKEVIILSDDPPERILTDYVELIVLTVMFIIGGPINLAAFNEMMHRRSNTRTPKGVPPLALGALFLALFNHYTVHYTAHRLDLLKRHLNYSDLLILFVFTPSRVCWLLTYDWRGGDLMCKLVKFSNTLALQISSNVIVCIALDRLFWVLWPLQNARARANARTRFMIGVAWLLAVLICCPQLVLWRVHQAYPGWYQCMQIWQIEAFEKRRYYRSHNMSMPAELETLSEAELLYSGLHLVFVFFLPLTVITVCYMSISCWVCANARVPAASSTCGSAAPSRFSNNGILLATEHNTRTVAGRGGLVTEGTRLADSTGLPSSVVDGNCCLPTALSTGKKRAIKSNVQFFDQVPPKIIVSVADDDTNDAQAKVEKRPGGGRQSLPENDVLICDNSADTERTPINTQSTANGNNRQNKSVSIANYDTAGDVTLACYSYERQQDRRARAAKRRALRISVVLVMGYVVCWLPYNVLSSWQFVDTKSYVVYNDKVYWLFQLIVLNSVINPFLYGMFGNLASLTRNE